MIDTLVSRGLDLKEGGRVRHSYATHLLGTIETVYGGKTWTGQELVPCVYTCMVRWDGCNYRSSHSPPDLIPLNALDELASI